MDDFMLMADTVEDIKKLVDSFAEVEPEPETITRGNKSKVKICVT